LAIYVELRGYKQGGDRKSKVQTGLMNLDEIAKELNMSKTNLKRALSIERNLTDSMKELLDKKRTSNDGSHKVSCNEILVSRWEYFLGSCNLQPPNF